MWNWCTHSVRERGRNGEKDQVAGRVAWCDIRPKESWHLTWHGFIPNCWGPARSAGCDILATFESVSPCNLLPLSCCSCKHELIWDHISPRIPGQMGRKHSSAFHFSVGGAVWVRRILPQTLTNVSAIISTFLHSRDFIPIQLAVSIYQRIKHTVSSPVGFIQIMTLRTGLMHAFPPWWLVT